MIRSALFGFSGCAFLERCLSMRVSLMIPVLPLSIRQYLQQRIYTFIYLILTPYTIISPVPQGSKLQ